MKPAKPNLYDRLVAARAITIFAWWKDGVQYVGTTGLTLKQAIANVLGGKYDDFLLTPVPFPREVQDDGHTASKG